MTRSAKAEHGRARARDTARGGPPAADARGGPPAAEPIGRAVTSAAKLLGRAFGDELAAAGGSQPVWLIVLELKQRRWRTQQDLAAAVGIEGPTLTHHLDGLERSGLIERTRDPGDRRAIRVELTPAGDELFHELRSAAMAFDRRLRAGVDADELDTFRRVLAQLRDNVAAP